MCWDHLVEAEEPDQVKAQRLPQLKKDDAKAPAKANPLPSPVREDVPALAEARS